MSMLLVWLFVCLRNFKMKKYKENLFSTKFCLLNSQECAEEIIWSSSDSNEFEDESSQTKCNSITSKKPNRKRKRKSKFKRNVSNLDITLIDVPNEDKGDKSPVLTCKTKSKTNDNFLDKSYLVAKLTESNSKDTKLTSPVLCTGMQRANLSIKSPIIAQKYASPVTSPKVRKTLFSENKKNNEVHFPQKSIFPEVTHHIGLDRRKIQREHNTTKVEAKTNNPELVIHSSISQEDKLPRHAKSGNMDLIEKVKSFFDNQFNSENSSQVSIADTPTPQSTSNDDIEVVSITQISSNESSVQTINYTNSTDNSARDAEKSKKMRYKKDGLAFRLCSLLKKHNASISLWQHERFLAENSNFKIPKGEHFVFRIQKVDFKYGSYLLEAMDGNDAVFFILINNSYVKNCIFTVDSIFKLYEPYLIFNFDHKQLIVNVCKFECVLIDV